MYLSNIAREHSEDQWPGGLIVPAACWQQLMFLFILIFLVFLVLLAGGELCELVSAPSSSSFHFDALSHDSNEADF